MEFRSAQASSTPDYEGEIQVLLRTTSDKTVTIPIGTAMAQILFIPVCLPDFFYSDDKGTMNIVNRHRGSQGFGSTDCGGKEGGLWWWRLTTSMPGRNRDALWCRRDSSPRTSLKVGEAVPPRTSHRGSLDVI